jgi:hypothetical protein
MSLPYEIVRAQEQLWNMFRDGELPRSKWPRHMITASLLELLYTEAGYSPDCGSSHSFPTLYYSSLEEPESETENSCNFF